MAPLPPAAGPHVAGSGAGAPRAASPPALSDDLAAGTTEDADGPLMARTGSTLVRHGPRAHAHTHCKPLLRFMSCDIARIIVLCTWYSAWRACRRRRACRRVRRPCTSRCTGCRRSVATRCLRQTSRMRAATGASYSHVRAMVVAVYPCMLARPTSRLLFERVVCVCACAFARMRLFVCIRVYQCAPGALHAQTTTGTPSSAFSPLTTRGSTRTLSAVTSRARRASRCPCHRVAAAARCARIVIAVVRVWCPVCRVSLCMCV